MKRIITLIVALVFTLALFCVPATAAGTGTLALTGAEGYQGDTVTLNVNLNSNPGLITMKFTISWGDGLELVSVSNAGLLAGWTTPAPTIKSPYTLRWAESLSTTDNTATGKIATLTFKIKDDAAIGSKNVTLTFSESRDASGAKNTFGNASATVKVKCKTHSYGDYTKVNDTNHAHTCTACGYTENQAHTWNGGTVTKPASCKETGTKEFTCSVCKGTKTETIPKTNDHTYGAWAETKAPGCESKGTETRTCSVCTKTETRDVAATGHSMGEWAETKAPGCETKGTETRTCSECTKTETRDIKALGHDFKNPTVTKEPTCTEKGTEKGTCTRCDKETTNPIPAKGHTYDDGVVKKEATETEEGLKVYTCTVCKGEKEEVIPMISPETTAPETELETAPIETEPEETVNTPDTTEEPETTEAPAVTTDAAPDTDDDGGNTGLIIAIVIGVAAVAAVAVVVIKKRR